MFPRLTLPIDIAYSSSYEDYDDEDRGVMRRRHPRYNAREHRNLMETSILKTTLIRFNMWRGSLSLNSIMMKILSNWPCLK